MTKENKKRRIHEKEGALNNYDSDSLEATFCESVGDVGDVVSSNDFAFLQIPLKHQSGMVSSSD